MSRLVSSQFLNATITKPRPHSPLNTIIVIVLTVASVTFSAFWQINATAVQNVVIGGSKDGGYVIGFHEREVAVDSKEPFRWLPPQGGALIFWPLSPGAMPILRLDIYRPDASYFTMQTGERQVRFGIEPGRRIYTTLIEPGSRRILLDVEAEITVAGEQRSLGAALMNASLVNVAQPGLSDLVATLLLAPFLPLALLGLSWFGLVLGGGYRFLLTPLALVAVIGAGYVWPMYRLEIAWIMTHVILVAVTSAVIYYAARRGFTSLLHNDRVITAFLIGCGILTLLLTFLPRVTSDGIGYYAYARALVYRHDLMMNETFAALSYRYPLPLTERGLLANPWSVGPALFWMAPLTIYRLLFGGDGHDAGAYATVCLVSALAGVGTIVVAYCCARRWFRPAASAVGALTAFHGSTLWFYSMREGSFAHALSAFCCALTLLAWLRVKEHPAPVRWIVFGASAGAMVLTYWATALLLIAPAIDIIRLIWSARDNFQRCVQIGSGCLVSVFIALVIFSPQMIVWFLIYGSPLVKPPSTPGLVWGDPHVLDLFIARFGLVRWSPAAMFGLIGLVMLARRGLNIGGAILIAALAYIVFNGLLSDWHGSGSFGTRRLTSLAAWYGLGLAAIAEALIRRKGALIAIVGAVSCSGWMLMLIMRITLGYFPKGTSAYALESMSATDLYLARSVFPTLEINTFLKSGFLWDTLTTAPFDFSMRVLPYLALLCALAVWACWRLSSGDLGDCATCVYEPSAIRESADVSA
ncbi:glycosyltransferase family 39 protein [Roseiflexus castenholzii]|uniref:glycosyltransferase family 39 protein n=1 Tax=Roseiflexus castenholzii TaxID=120962 RepID=UPI003C79F5E7